MTKQPKKVARSSRQRPAPRAATGQPAYADLVRIVEVLRATERFSEFRLKAGDIEIEVKRTPGSQAPVAAAALPAASVPAGCAGTVTHVLAADGATLVEGQPLVAVRPG